AGTGDQHVVVAGRDAIEPRAPHLAQLTLDPVALDRAADGLRHGEAEARSARVVLGEPVEDEEPRRRGAAAAIDGVEVPRTGQTVRAFHERQLTPTGACGP